MDSIQYYKHKLNSLHQYSLNTSIKHSQECWDRYPSKRKKLYNQCSYSAAHLIHVYYDGKRRLKQKKSEMSSVCAVKHEGDIEGLRSCRVEMYKELVNDVESLHRKLLREEERYNEEVRK